jgi:hypothetical protein
MFRGFLVAGLLALAAPVLAQDQAPPKLPTSEHAKLELLVGTWDVATRFKLGGGEHTGSARCEAAWALNGHMLRQEYHSKMNGQPFTVLQFYGYDQGKKKFFELKMDSMDTGVMHNEGSASDDGKVLTFRGERVDARTGKTIPIRTVITIQDADHYTLEWYMPGPDGQEENTVTLTHTRAK